MTRSFLKIFSLLLLALTISCEKVAQDRDSNNKDLQGTLQLRLAVTGNATQDQTTLDQTTAQSRATANLPTPDVDNFMVSIVSLADGSEVISSPYSEFPYSLNMVEGDYRIVAQIGQDIAFATENPYFKGEQTFAVTRGEITNLDVKASLSGLAVDIVYSADFITNFKSYYIEAEIDDVTDNYVYAQDGTNLRAYFKPARIRLILRGVMINDKPYSTVIKELFTQRDPITGDYTETPVGKRLYTLRLNISPKGHTFDIQTVTEVQQVETGGVIDPDALPDMPPIAASVMEFYETSATAVNGSSVDLEAILGLKALEFTFTGDEFARFGLVGTMSVNDAAQFAAMQAAGIQFEEGLVDKMTNPALYHKRTTVDFSALARKMLSHDGISSSYRIHVKTTDVLNKSSENDLTIKIYPPLFSLPDVEPGAVWSKTATFSPLSVSKGDLDYMLRSGLLKYQLSTDNTNWVDVAGTTLDNLSNSTTYLLRALYRTTTSNTVSFTTEAAPQVPNAGFENWTINNVNKGVFNKGYPHYKPWDGSVAEWWNTSNTRCFTYNVSTTQYNNPTSVLYTKSAKSGGKTAEIRSVKIDVSGRSNVCGKLLIGSLTSGSTNGLLTGNNNPEYLTEGRDFASRPTKIRFWYKYNQYGTDNYVITVRMRNGSTVIAEAIATGGGTDTDYKQMEIEIPYSNTELKATSLYVCFASSNGDGFENRTISVEYPDEGQSGWKAMVGSILWIDDVELIYEK